MNAKTVNQLAASGNPNSLHDRMAEIISREPFHTSRPRKGDPITYLGEVIGVVSSVEGNLCWVRYENKDSSEPFIWRFHDGLNTLHDWPNKHASQED